MSWQHSDVDMVVWLGINNVWPSHTVRQGDGRHLSWEYESERPQDLIDRFFAPGNQVRKVLDIRGRLLKRSRSASALASDRIPFEPPLR